MVRSDAPPLEEFRSFIRDLYIPSGDLGYWQAAIREPDDPLYVEIADAATERRALSVDLLYSDQVGGQRTITRFGLVPEEDGWRIAVARHFYLDVIAPR